MVDLGRKLDGPWNLRTDPEKFTVDEIGDPAKKDPYRGDDDHVIPEVRPRVVFLFGVDEEEYRDSRYGAMARHPPLPDDKNFGERPRRVEEEIADPPPDEHAEEGEKGHEIREFLRCDLEELFPAEAPEEEVGHDEAAHVGESLPTDAERFGKLDEEGVEVVEVVGEDGWKLGFQESRFKL